MLILKIERTRRQIQNQHIDDSKVITMQVYICDCCGASSQPIPDSENEYRPNDKFEYMNGIHLCDECRELAETADKYLNLVFTKYKRRCNHEHNKETGQNKVEPYEDMFEEQPERITQIQKMLFGETSRTRKTEQSSIKLNVKYECPSCGRLQKITMSKMDDMNDIIECGYCGRKQQLKEGFKDCGDPYIPNVR